MSSICSESAMFNTMLVNQCLKNEDCMNCTVVRCPASTYMFIALYPIVLFRLGKNFKSIKECESVNNPCYDCRFNKDKKCDIISLAKKYALKRRGIRW